MTFRGQPRVDTSDESSQFTIPVVRIGGDRARSPDSERGNLPSVSVFCVIRGALRIRGQISSGAESYVKDLMAHPQCHSHQR